MGQAILKVTFRNINLVDSFHNEPLSHGFFTYTIKHDPALANDEQFRNTAYIYFDGNTPVQTNTTWHTVTDSYFRVISSVVESKQAVQTTAYPNPFRDKCVIEIKNLQKRNSTYQFILYDINGKIVEKRTVEDRVELHAKGLASNIYLYRIEQDGELVGAGKIVKE
jgi:hypothetical protein